MKALNDVGPLYVSFASSPTFLKHKSGVYGLFCPYNASKLKIFILIESIKSMLEQISYLQMY